MSKHDYAVAINVHEDYANTEKDIHYSITVPVLADDVQDAEDKIIEWYEKQNIEGFVEFKVKIVKTIPKLY